MFQKFRKQLIFSITILLVSLLQTGCGTGVKSTVTYFYTTAPPVGSSVAIEASDWQSKNLEFNHYKSLLEIELQNSGFAINNNQETADYLGEFTYGVDRQGNTETYVVPRTTTSTNAYGQTTSSTSYSRRTRQVHQREVQLYLKKNRSETGLDEGSVHMRLLSAGSSNEMAAVMPTFIYQLFKKWPGKSGKAYSIISSTK